MIYFDNAATTFPKPKEVIRGVAECMQNYGGNPGRGAHPLALAAAEAVYSTREELASLFGGKSENTVFTQNATHALNLVIFGLARHGDHIIISNLEHNSVLRPVAELYRRGIASYSVFDALCSEEETLENLKKAVRRNTRIAVTTHVSNICPHKLPIEKISAFCRERGILHIVDASQSAGIYDINMQNGLSVLCAPGHKGLYGPQGTGFCLFADDFDFERLRPTVFGGNGINSAKTDMGKVSPESYEGGTLAVPSIAGLGAGVHFVKRIGTAKIRAHEAALCEKIKQNLRSDGRIKIYLPEESGSALLFNAYGIDGSELARRLARRGICTRAGLHCAPTAHEALGTGGDAVRLSFSAFNTAEEAESFCAILKECLKE
ncbi:MAG: aminotransferase class V-fold PLP-dependent enzyme [Clostridia bacterium]|nr:aminotransferase class V-fold PLP-dependent enzyme [Clostridia bacterium]